MEKILSSLFSFLKYFLLIAAFGLVFFGIVKTYGRLEKPISDAMDIFIAFALVLVMFIVNLFIKNRYVSDNLFFNFVSVFTFLVIIVICLRSLFDVNMILWHKYNIDFNPAYFADNIPLVKSLLYMVAGSNLLLVICGIIDRKKKGNIVLEEKPIKKAEGKN